MFPLVPAFFIVPDLEDELLFADLALLGLAEELPLVELTLFVLLGAEVFAVVWTVVTSTVCFEALEDELVI